MNAERMLIMFGRARAEPIYSKSKPTKAGFLLTLYMPRVTMEVFFGFRPHLRASCHAWR